MCPLTLLLLAPMPACLEESLGTGAVAVPLVVIVYCSNTIADPFFALAVKVFTASIRNLRHFHYSLVGIKCIEEF